MNWYEEQYKWFRECALRWCWKECVVVGEVANAFLKTERNSRREDVKLEDALDQHLYGETCNPFNEGLMSIIVSGTRSSAFLVHLDTRDNIRRPFGSLHIVEISRTWSDLVTAIYLPIDELAVATLVLDQRPIMRWLNDGSGWTAAPPETKALKHVLRQAQQIPHPSEFAEQIKVDSESLVRELSSQRKTTLSLPYNRSDFIEWRGQKYQRILLGSPCVPTASFFDSSLALEFERDVDCFVESILLLSDARNSLMRNPVGFKWSPVDDFWLVEKSPPYRVRPVNTNENSTNQNPFNTERDLVRDLDLNGKSLTRAQLAE
jgi:hypothetical protein